MLSQKAEQTKIQVVNTRCLAFHPETLSPTVTPPTPELRTAFWAELRTELLIKGLSSSLSLGGRPLNADTRRPSFWGASTKSLLVDLGVGTGRRKGFNLFPQFRALVQDGRRPSRTPLAHDLHPSPQKGPPRFNTVTAAL